MTETDNTNTISNTIGWAEWLSLPQLQLPLIRAKVDTGACTSALHADIVETFDKNGQLWVRFQLHPLTSEKNLVRVCEAPIVDERLVRDSGGKSDRRYVIETLATINGKTRSIEITLTNRRIMRYRMLFGRQAIAKFDLLVNPAHTFLLAKNTRKRALAAYESDTP
jgi:hypothetical protein